MREKALDSEKKSVSLDENLTMSWAPHIRSNESTRRIMLDVIIAMIPIIIGSIYYFGLSALKLIVISVVSAVTFEAATQKFFKKDILIGDLSAVVTGIMLAFNLPPNAPWWIAVFGAGFAIIIVKEFFGGIGSNFMNPALAARVVLSVSWPAIMTDYISPDGIASATPLSLINSGSNILPSLMKMITGNIAGALGETSVICILIGAAYLLIRRIIDWKIPVSFILSTGIMLIILGVEIGLIWHHILGGGLLLGVFFMATDYSTSPITPKGKVVFGIGAGIITALIKIKGGASEGVSYAILLMNAMTPVIEKFTRPKVFGGEK